MTWSEREDGPFWRAPNMALFTSLYRFSFYPLKKGVRDHLKIKEVSDNKIQGGKIKEEISKIV